MQEVILVIRASFALSGRREKTLATRFRVNNLRRFLSERQPEPSNAEKLLRAFDGPGSGWFQEMWKVAF